MGTLELYGHAIRRLRPHLGRLALAIAGVLLASATEVLKPWPLKIVIDNVLLGRPLPDGSPGPSLYCAVIVKTVDAQTRAKTSINELLRD